ncbi:MAG: hypothetical protein J7J44_07435, partial [Deltaproteobacteria bacterium]|nr:hypothetical protein [Deltaproteobacteria bacterium]
AIEYSPNVWVLEVKVDDKPIRVKGSWRDLASTFKKGRLISGNKKISWEHFTILLDAERWIEELFIIIPKKYKLQPEKIRLSYHYKVDFVEARYQLGGIEEPVSIDVMIDDEMLHKLYVGLGNRLFLAIEERAREKFPEEKMFRVIHEALDRMMEELKLEEVGFEYNKDVLKNWKLYPEAYISTAYGLRKIVSVSPDWWVYDGERSWSCHPNTTIYIPKGVEKKEKKEEKITYEDLIKALSKVYATDEKGIIYTLIGLLFDGVSPEDLKDSLTKIACDVIQGASPELVEDAVDTLVAIAVRGYKSRKEIYKVEKERKIAPEIKPEITVEEVREDYSKFINEGNFSMAAMLDYLISRKGARWNPKIEEALEVLIEGGYPEEKVEKIKSWFWK